MSDEEVAAGRAYETFRQSVLGQTMIAGGHGMPDWFFLPDSEKQIFLDMVSQFKMVFHESF